MKKNYFPKTALAISIALLAGTSASAAFAASPVPSPQSIQTVQLLKKLDQDVINLQKRTQAIAEAQSRSQVLTQYQINPSVMKSMSINTAYANGKDTNDNNIAKATLAEIQKKLSYLPTHLLTTGPDTTNSAAVSQELAAEGNSEAAMTKDLPASDTIYSNNDLVVQKSLTDNTLKSQFRKGLGLGAPTQLNDAAFDYTNLIQPTNYNPDQLTAAQDYVNFVMHDYNHPEQYINTEKFVNYVQGLDPKAQAQAYAELINSDEYRQYQLKVRSAMTARTLALNGLEHLIYERTPVKNLGKEVGLTDKQGKPMDDASPLQVESYMANRRVNNPKWYAHVQSESPAAVQRETLVVLSEIESQLYQAHIDRERLLGLESVKAASAANVSDQLLHGDATPLNNVIDKITDSQSDTQTSVSPDQTNTSGTNS